MSHITNLVSVEKRRFVRIGKFLLIKLLEDISNERKYVPRWMFNQTGGVMIDAITSENFDQYLGKVADERWINFFDEYVFSHELDHVLKLEKPS